MRYRQYTPGDDQPLVDGDAGWSGVNLRLDPRLLPKGVAAAAVNTRFRNGAPQPRGGCAKLPWLNKLTPGSTTVMPFGNIYGAGEFNDPDSNYWEIIAADGDIYKLLANNAATTVSLPPDVSVTYPVFLVQAFNDLLMFRGPQLAPLVLTDIDEGFANLTNGISNFLYASTYAQNAEILFPPNCGFNYSLSQAYAPGDIVLFTDGNHYLNLADANAGQSPSNAPTLWQDLTYNPALSYANNTLVVYQATLFTAAEPAGIGIDPLNNPDIWTPVKSQLWEAIGPGSTTAGQTPVTTPAAWNYVRDFIPNASFALSYQNMLWVIHSRDLVAVSDVLDYSVYQPQINELRVNQGSADQLVCLYKYNDTTLFAFKEQSVYVISNITGTLANIQLDTLTTDYGIAGPRAVTMAGTDLWFFSKERGITSFTQTELNMIHGADKPVSEPIQPLVDRVNWELGAQIGMFWDNNYLYCSVPLDDATVTQSGTQIPPGAVYTKYSTYGYFYDLPVVPGATYLITPGPNALTTGIPNDLAVWNPSFALPPSGSLNTGNQTLIANFPSGGLLVTATSNVLTLQGFATNADENPTLAVTFTVKRVLTNCNNGIFIYDFFNGQWAGYDTGEAVVPMYFFRNLFAGDTRLFFVGYDGFVNLYEEGSYDAIWSSAAPGTAATPIAQSVTTRMYLGSTLDPKKTNRFSLQVDTWNPSFSLTAIFPGVKTPLNLLSNVTRSRTKYIRPFYAAPYVATNVNGDHDKPNREDYSVDPSVEPGVYFDAGVTVDLFQEATWRGRFRGQAPGVQFEFANATGSAIVRNLEVEADPGSRREGVQ